jgi:hypothetical protein
MTEQKCEHKNYRKLTVNNIHAGIEKLTVNIKISDMKTHRKLMVILLIMGKLH